MSKRIIWSAILIAVISCGNQSTSSMPKADDLNLVSFTAATEDYILGYDLTNPNKRLKLSKKLEEVSGLSLSRDGQQIVAVEDERGKIYLLDKQTGEILKDFDFWKSGDYEGVEVVGSEIYVLKSSGTIYRVINPGKENQTVEKFNSFLDSDNDVEGLAYDPVKHRLLLACKAKAGQGKAFQGKKSIYAFDLNTLTLQPEPAFVVSLSDIHTYLGTTPAIRKLDKLAEMFKPGSELIFAPSAVAIHPITGDIYILSSVGKVLMVINSSGQLQHIEKLRKEVHSQPEGLCFDVDGTLYIANEGKGGRGEILIFNYSK